MENRNILNSYFKHLNNLNNSKTFRRMLIKKDNDVKCIIHVKTVSCKPFITTPSKQTMDNLILFDVSTTLGGYKEYDFQDDIALDLTKEKINLPSSELRVTLPEEQVEEYLSTYLDVKGNPLKDQNRYIPYLTIDNPVLKTDTTIFIDKKHGDMFYIAGLKFLLDSSVETSNNPIEVYGYAIGGHVDITKQIDLSAPPSPSYRYQYENATIDFGSKINLDTTSLYQNSDDVKAYGVVFTKELPSNNLSTNFPVIYDKASKNSAEVQIARQDGFPSIVVQLGKLKKFFEGEPGDVYGWILYCSTLSRINIIPNGNIKNKDAILSFVMDLY